MKVPKTTLAHSTNKNNGEGTDIFRCLFCFVGHAFMTMMMMTRYAIRPIHASHCFGFVCSFFCVGIRTPNYAHT